MTFGWTVAKGSNELTLGGFYSLVVLLVFSLTVLCLFSAIGLSVYSDQVEKPGGAVESSVSVLWHCVTTLVGGLVGLITGPGIARASQN